MSILRAVRWYFAVGSAGLAMILAMALLVPFFELHSSCLLQIHPDLLCENRILSETVLLSVGGLMVGFLFVRLPAALAPEHHLEVAYWALAYGMLFALAYFTFPYAVQKEYGEVVVVEYLCMVLGGYFATGFTRAAVRKNHC